MAPANLEAKLATLIVHPSVTYVLPNRPLVATAEVVEGGHLRVTTGVAGARRGNGGVLDGGGTTVAIMLIRPSAGETTSPSRIGVVRAGSRKK